MRSTLSSVVIVGLVAAGSVGCRGANENADKSHPEPTANVPPTPPAQQAPPAAAPGQPPAMGGGPKTPPTQMTPAAAVASIAAAECDHQVRCNNVGADKKYKTRDECISKEKKDKSGGINAEACPGGINEGNFNRCVEVLRNESCGNVGDFFERAESCKKDAFCVKK